MPPWGDVLPGTDEVRYFAPLDPAATPKLFRTVAMDGAFYVEGYVGGNLWQTDSEPMTYLLTPPGEPANCDELEPRDAARRIAALDLAG
jgi:hypothetical protein